MPEKTATPMAERISAPAPLASTKGSTPMMKASEVIRMGRSRSLAASMAAASGDRPANSSSRANSTMRMAFLAESPTSTMSPIWVKTLLSPPKSQTPAMAESSPIGTMSKMASGSVRLSYWAASTRNTSRMASGKTHSAELPARIS
ncbi:hypothetical protein D3C78_479940 [compost metagenome]